MEVQRHLCGNISRQRNITIQVVFVISGTFILRTITSKYSRTNSRWQSWLITAHESLTSAQGSNDPRLAEFLSGVTKGIEYFHSHIDEGIEYIVANLGYTAQDARDWLKTVQHVKDASKVDPTIIQNTITILQKAGVVKGQPTVESLVIKEAF